MTAATIIGCSILFLIASFASIYLFGSIFGKKPVKGLIYNRNKLPHENYPEIIEWGESDSFCKESNSLWDEKIWCRIKSIHQDGIIIIVIDNHSSRRLENLHISKFIKDWTNIDSIKRKKEQKQKDILSIIENDPVYNKFLNDYRSAFKEIKSN
jgi:hypothetical protein